MKHAIHHIGWHLLFWICLSLRAYAIEPADIQAAILASAQQATPRKPAVPETPESTALAPSTGPAAGETFAELSAGAQPTPWIATRAMLNAADLKGDETLWDPGCGHDARLLIEAVKHCPNWTGSAVGVEIDPEAADSARQSVEAEGLSDRIMIITGDSTKLDPPPGAVCVAYMWPEVLTALRPQFAKCDRVVTYAFAVPNVAMQERPAGNGASVYVWKSAPAVTQVQVPITKTYRQTVRLPRGSYCQVCGRNCSNPMAHKLQQ